MINKATIRSLLPLFFIITIIMLITFFTQLMRGFTISGTMYDFMAFFFIIFGSFKLIHWSAFVDAYEHYDLIAQKSRIYGYLYPLIEISLGICYFLRYHLAYINTATIILMCISSAGVVRQLQKKEPINCACLGTVFKLPMTYITLAEDLLMALMALIMLIAY